MSNIIKRAMSAGLVVMTMSVAGCTQGKYSERLKTYNEGRSTREATSTSLAAAPEDDGVSPVTVLTVNGHPIDASDVLIPAMADLLEKSRSYSLTAYQTYVADLARFLIRDRVREVLLFQTASARLSDQEKDAIEKLTTDTLRERVTLEAGGVQHVYERLLAERGTSLKRERERIYRENVVRRHLALNVYPQVNSPTRDELLSLYDRYLAENSKPERRRMSLIEVNALAFLPGGVRQPSRTQLADARSRATRQTQSIAESLASGADFQDQARTHSNGIFAHKGGDWGWVSTDGVREKWLPAVNVLYELEEGAVSEIIESGDSLFIVKCEEIEQAYRPGFVEVQPDLILIYRQANGNDLVNQMAEELVQKAHIVPYDWRRFHQAVVDAAPPHAAQSDALSSR